MNKNRRTRFPTQEKQRAYKKDRFVQAEYPHAFRKHWPRKKTYSHRQYRHRMRDAVLAVIPPTLSEDALDELEIKPVRRAPVQKWKSQEGETAPRLEEIVEYRLERRAQRTLLSFFKHPYDSARDREHFAHFLESIVESQSVAVHKIAHELEMLLNAPQMIAIGGYQRMSRRSAWLDSFLADEPAWEERLRAWIAKLHLTDAV